LCLWTSKIFTDLLTNEWCCFVIALDLKQTPKYATERGNSIL
jgi:hypothetical protein